MVASCLALIICTTANAQIHYPLDHGNRWQYEEPPPPEATYIIEVRVTGDTTFSNGLTYRVLETFNYGHPDPIGVEYERVVGNQVFRYAPHGEIDGLKFDFDSQVGDTVATIPELVGSEYDTLVVTVVGAGIGQSFGAYRNYMVFLIESLHTTLYWMYVVTDSLGITYSQVETGYELDLMGARISGTDYGVVTKVQIAPDISVSHFSVMEAYPNPFNSSTTISVVLRYPARTRMSIWNSIGQCVRRLYDGDLEAGVIKVVWDGRVTYGGDAPSGLYIIRVEVGGEALNRKCLLLK